MEYWFLQRLERSLSSLAGCYALLASLAAILLIYARFALESAPPDSPNVVGELARGSTSLHAVNGARILAGTRATLSALRDRMHSTWLFFGVFAAVWLACLLWMQIERYRRGLSFSRRQAYWIAGLTVAVSAAAVLYGLGTNGILAQRLPGIVPVSDVLALGFLLALPLVAWSRLGRLQEEQEDAEADGEGTAAPRPRGILGLNDEESNARLIERLSRIEVKTVELAPAAQIFHPELPSEHTMASVNQLMETAEAPVVPQYAAPEPALPQHATTEPAVSQYAAPEMSAPTSLSAPTATPSSVPPVTSTAAQSASTGVVEFRDHLAAMNQSWQRIEATRREIEEWFEQRRRQAIARLDMHPGMRSSAIESDLFQNFPDDKLASVDAEWAEIRRAALGISRWFGEVPAPDERK